MNRHRQRDKEVGLAISAFIEVHVKRIRREKGELATESVHRMENFTVSFGNVLISKN